MQQYPEISFRHTRNYIPFQFHVFPCQVGLCHKLVNVQTHPAVAKKEGNFTNFNRLSLHLVALNNQSISFHHKHSTISTLLMTGARQLISPTKRSAGGITRRSPFRRGPCLWS